MDIYDMEREHIRNMIRETDDKIMEDLMDEYRGTRMFKLTTCKNYGRDEYLYEASWDDKKLTLDDFLKHYAGDWEGTPNRVYIFKKRYPFQKGVFVSGDYDRLDDLNVDELRPLAVDHIYAVGGWGPIDYYIKLV